MVRRNTKQVITKHSIRRQDQNNYSDTELRQCALSTCPPCSQHSLRAKRWSCVRIWKHYQLGHSLTWPSDVSPIYKILLQLKREGYDKQIISTLFVWLLMQELSRTAAAKCFPTFETRKLVLSWIPWLLLSLVEITFYSWVLCQRRSSQDCSMFSKLQYI